MSGRAFGHHNVRPGTRPGTLQEQSTAAEIRWMNYSPAGVEEDTASGFDQLPRPRRDAVLWLDITGTPGSAGLAALQQNYGVHALALEDVQSGGQNPKLEAFDHHLFLVALIPTASEHGVVFRQVNFFLADGIVISIHDDASLFAPVAERIHAGKGRIRAGGEEYLLYALLDIVVDRGFLFANGCGDSLELLEQRVEHGDGDLSGELYALRRQLSAAIRQAERQAQTISGIIDGGQGASFGEHKIYWRDCQDHAVRVRDLLSHYRDAAADLLNTHLALISHRTNDVMRVLTMIATVFIPLSFMVGLYGMNFDTESPFNMPELGWRFGYFSLLGLMLTVVVGLLWYFRKKRWL